MTKPLELVVYPKRRVTLEGFFGNMEHHFEYAVNGKLIDEQDIYPSIKRLTDAELAAEYFGALAHFERMGFNEVSSGDDWDDATWSRIAHPMQVLHRFATLPHYDEPTP